MAEPNRLCALRSLLKVFSFSRMPARPAAGDFILVGHIADALSSTFPIFMRFKLFLISIVSAVRPIFRAVCSSPAHIMVVILAILEIYTRFRTSETFSVLLLLMHTENQEAIVPS